ncbi:hypothetical protein [Flavobacterium adhaerens]|uniref:hypothetical protein n=1 Tax=Flavobacterium adhaerens TaxID=3149043 RepID=UPI0032B42BB1
MKTITYIKNKIEFFLRSIKVEPFNPKNELNHPRFDVDENFDLKSKKGNSSLLFHMYSKDNETLFI